MLIFLFFSLGVAWGGRFFSLDRSFLHLLCRKDFSISGERRPFQYWRGFFPAYHSSALLIWSDLFFLFEG